MEPRTMRPLQEMSLTEKFWRGAADLEDRIDRVALRLGDALFGPRRSERIFGPHPEIW